MKRIIGILCFSMSLTVSAQDTWRGLIVKPEYRCSPYDKKTQYPYSQSVEDTIVALMDGRIYGPYSARYFSSDTETDIEHIVSSSEGHDSGLCDAPKEKRIQFATDQLNLTLAAPEINRCGTGGKCGLDAAEWMPEKNKCWFANRIVQIKNKYELSVNRAEAESLEFVLSNCDSVEMQYLTETVNSVAVISDDKPVRALELYDDNKNGRITCSEARFHDIAPVKRDNPAYAFMRDSDGDGIVCE